MLYIITFIMIFLNLIFKKSKGLYFVDFIYLLIMLGFSYGSYDTMIFIYRYMYPERYEGFTELLFNGIVNLINSFNANYRTFMVLIAFVELIMILNFIKKYTNSPCYVIAVFIIFPMILVFEQLRFLMAYTIVLTLGIDCLIEKKKFYRLKALLYIGIASLIHSSVIIYLIFILADWLSKKQTIFFTIICCTGLIVLGISPQIWNFVGVFIGSEKLEIISRVQKGQDGQFGCSALSIAVFLEYMIFYWYAKRNKKSLGLDNKEFEYLDLILKFNIISFISIPMIWNFSVAFMRIAVNLLILNYIAFSKAIYYNKTFIITKEKFVLVLITILYAIMLFFFSSHTKTAFELNVYPFFEENEFLNKKE